jgi:hypothetical protein
MNVAMEGLHESLPREAVNVMLKRQFDALFEYKYAPKRPVLADGDLISMVKIRAVMHNSTLDRLSCRMNSAGTSTRKISSAHLLRADANESTWRFTT